MTALFCILASILPLLIGMLAFIVAERQMRKESKEDDRN